MRATLEVRSLRGALAPMMSVVEKRNMVPVLSFVKLEVKDGRLHVTSTNLDSILAIDVPLAGNGEYGAVLVPAHTLFRIVKGFSPADFVRLETVDGRLRVDFDGARFSLVTLPVGDFPPFAELGEPSKSFTLPAGWCQKQLARVAHFMSGEETRYYLNGVCAHIYDGKLAIVATDGHKLARVISDIDPRATLGNSRVIIPKYAVWVLTRHLHQKAEVCFIGGSKAHMLFTAPGFFFATKLIDGNFPDYERVIPRGSANQGFSISGNADALIKAISRLTGFVGARAIQFRRVDRRLIASVDDHESGRASVAIPGEFAWTAKPDAVCVNGKIFTGVLRQVGKNIRVDFDGPGMPILITPKDSSDIFVQMPMRGDLQTVESIPGEQVAA